MAQRTVYRMYDSDGALLYIGCSFTPLRRVTQHQSKPWWLDIARVTLEHHATHREGFAAETAAIIAESPRYNNVPPAWEQQRRKRVVAAEPEHAA